MAEIEEVLDRVAAKVERIKVVRAKRISGGGSGDIRVEVRRATAIKIETSPVASGTAHPVERRRVNGRVEDQFGFAEMQVAAFKDLFGIKLLHEHEGLRTRCFAPSSSTW